MRLSGSLGKRLLVGFMFLTVMSSTFVGLGQAASAACASPSIVFGRWRWCGYWYNKFQDEGDAVRLAGVPGSVNTVAEFENLITGDLASGDKHKITAAKFIVLTMIGAKLPSPPQAVGSAKALSAAQLQEWKDRLASMSDISESSNVSKGLTGTITWFVNQHLNCGVGNTYWQPAYDDIAPYTNNAANSTCEDAGVKEDFIVFRNTANQVVYTIRRPCMNPMGTLGVLPDNVPPDYKLTPTVTSMVNGDAADTAEPGDTINFTYTVKNAGAVASPSNTSCTIWANVKSGYYASGTPMASGSNPGVATGCPKSFAGKTTVTVGSETINAGSGNQTICRSFQVAPSSASVASAIDEACVVVATKPYVRSYGGDVSVGGGLANADGSCTATPSNSSVISWNREAGGAWGGAGTQYAVFAMGEIQDFASGLGNSGSATAQPPADLSFANTSVDTANGDFGGDWGDAQCIPDYYSTMPASAAGNPLPGGNVSAWGDGAYSASGQVTVSGGNVNPNQRTQVFIDGDLYITGNVTYAGSWASAKIPLMEFVVKGNIFIDADVSQLDGVYIAQDDGSNTKGIIYTCADSFTPISVDANMYGKCDNTKLTVNGSFVANSIRLMRTKGSVKQGQAGDNPSASTAGEVFNYNPALWIAQPSTGSNVGKYDSVTSLPPIL